MAALNPASPTSGTPEKQNASSPNIIFVTSHKRVGVYFKYALRLLDPALKQADIEVPPPRSRKERPVDGEGGGARPERESDKPLPFAIKADGSPAFQYVVVRGAGRAMSNAVVAADFLKKLVPVLHQVTALGKSEVADVLEPSKEGEEEKQQKRELEFISITLSVLPLEQGSKLQEEVMQMLTEGGAGIIDAETNPKYIELREIGRRMRLLYKKSSPPTNASGDGDPKNIRRPNRFALSGETSTTGGGNESAGKKRRSRNKNKKTVEGGGGGKTMSVGGQQSARAGMPVGAVAGN